MVFSLGLTFSLFAGHLQTTFYLVLFSLFYFLWRLFSAKERRRQAILLFCLLYSVFCLFSLPQWRPTLELINLSARGVDQIDWQKPGWFIPVSHLAQFLAPDFFGNPTTLNYWGEWNYGEFVGFIGVIPLILAFLAFLGRRKKEVLFFGFSALIFLSFALPTPWAKLPFRLQLPLLSTSQPTRLIFLVDFCLSVLALLC